MRRIKVIMLIILVFMVGLHAQQIKIKKMSLKEFPDITAILSIENKWGAPVLVDTKKLKLYEEDQWIQDIEVVAMDSAVVPIYTVIIIDKSGSMKGEAIEMAKAGAVEFIKMMKGEDQVAYIEFDTKVTVVSEFTKDSNNVIKKVQDTRVGSDTALYDSIFQGVRLIKKAPDTCVKIIIVLTDGRENKSKHKLDEVISESQDANVSVYSIGLGCKINQDVLKDIALKTEANYYHAPEPKSLVEIYKRISLLLHSQLRLTFKTPFEMDDKWHSLKIVIPYMGKEITGEKKYLSAKESRIPTELLRRIREQEKQKMDAERLRALERQKQDSKKSSEKKLVLILAIALAILMLILVVALIIRRKK